MAFILLLLDDIERSNTPVPIDFFGAAPANRASMAVKEGVGLLKEPHPFQADSINCREKTS